MRGKGPGAAGEEGLTLTLILTLNLTLILNLVLILTLTLAPPIQGHSITDNSTTRPPLQMLGESRGGL